MNMETLVERAERLGVATATVGEMLDVIENTRNAASAKITNFEKQVESNYKDAMEAASVAAAYAEDNKMFRKENAKLRAFAQDVLTPFQNGISGGDLQKLAEKHGLLSYEIRYEPCGEGCICDEYFSPGEWNRGARCYRKTALLTGE